MVQKIKFAAFTEYNDLFSLKYRNLNLYMHTLYLINVIKFIKKHMFMLVKQMQ